MMSKPDSVRVARNQLGLIVPTDNLLAKIDRYSKSVNNLYAPVKVEANASFKYDANIHTQVKLFGLYWLQNKRGMSGAQAVVISQKKQNQIILKSWTKRYGALWTCCSPKQGRELLNSNKGIYEILTNYPQKVYFDIDREDLNDETAEYLNDLLLPTINKYFPNADFAISGSVSRVDNTYKTSYHIVLTNYMLSNETEKYLLKTLVGYLRVNVDVGFDTRVYNRNQCFKLVNQSKPNKAVQAVITKKEIYKHFISCYINKLAYPFPEFDDIGDNKDDHLYLQLHKEKMQQPLNFSDLPSMKRELPKHFSSVVVTPEILLHLLH